jgi:hypothetical protein
VDSPRLGDILIVAAKFQDDFAPEIFYEADA